MLKAIVFDFDGTILDTETVWYEVFSEIYSQHGVSISREEYASIVGTQFDASAHLESLTKKSIDRDRLDRQMDEEHVKPHPELYLKAIEELQVEKGEAVAIEDSPNGTKSAVAAGIRTLIVPNELTKGYAFERYDVRVESLEEVSIDWLERQLEGVCGS